MSETPRFSPPAIITHPLDRMTRRLCVGLSAAAFAISAVLGLKSLSAPEPPVFVSVSVKSLLEEQMLSGLGRDVAPEELERRSADYITALEAVLARYSEDERVILIASEAVLGETVPDFTQEVRQEAYRLAGELAARRGQSLPALGDTSGADRLVRTLTAETANMRAALDGPPGFSNAEAGQ